MCSRHSNGPVISDSVRSARSVTNAGKPVTKDSPITNLSGRIHCEKYFTAIVKTIRVHVEIYLADFLKTNPAKFAA